MRKDIYERIRVLKMDEIKPNFTELAKAWGCDYRTAKKYFYQDESKPPIRKQMPSKLDPYKEIINEKLKHAVPIIQSINLFARKDIMENIQFLEIIVHYIN